MARRPKRCRRCGKPATENRPISLKGNCPECGVRAFKAAQRVNRAGGILANPEWSQRWLEGVTSAVESAGTDAEA